MTAHVFYVGEYIGLHLQSSEADISPFGSVTAKMQLLALGKNEYDPAGATPISMTVTPVAASGDILAGWVCSLSSAQSALLAEGRYIVQAKIPVSTEIINPEPIIIIVNKGVANHA